MTEQVGKRKTARFVDWIEARINLTEIFALLTSFGLFHVEVDTNKPLRAAVREALSKPTPSYARWPQVLGPLVVLFFLFQGVTGLLLAFYYRPSALEAYESLRFILRDVSFGWLVHQVHRWGGQLLIVVLLLRLVRFFFQGVYRSPRELLWVTSVFLLIVATHVDLSGRLLTWNQISYWSTVRGLEVMLLVPVVGPLLSFLLGGTEITDAMLTRFYLLHVAVLPLLFLVLLYVNFATVRRVGLTGEATGHYLEARQRYRDYLYNLLILSVVILGFMATLAVILPVPFLPELDPFTTPVGVGPPWYLMASHVLVDVVLAGMPDPLKGGVLLLLLLVLACWPFVHRRWFPATGRRGWEIAVGVGGVSIWIVLTLYGLSLEP